MNKTLFRNGEIYKKKKLIPINKEFYCSCVHDDNPRLSVKVVNTYCWVHTTFTLPKYLNQPFGQGKSLLIHVFNIKFYIWETNDTLSIWVCRFTEAL